MPAPAEPSVPKGAIALQAITPEALARELGCEIGEARKIVSAVQRDKPLAPTAGVRRGTLEAARARGVVPTVRVVGEQASALDPFVKLALETGGDVIEAVRIPLERAGRFSACVSSQAGCALACAFCATGRLGPDAQPGDVGDRRAGAAWCGGGCSAGRHGRVHGVVFQGMGEPLANLDRVLEAIPSCAIRARWRSTRAR